MVSSSRQLIIGLTLVAFGLLSIVFLSDLLERNRVAMDESYRDRDLSFQGKRLKGFALGAEGLLADWYWMRSLQYLGQKVVEANLERIDIEDLRPLNPRLLYPLLDNATSLDPKFLAPYSFGATVLPAISNEQAVAITEKGINDNPEQWRFYQYLGYIHWRSKNFEAAGNAYQTGSEIPGAPQFMRMMAARMQSEGGSRATAREIYSQMLISAPDPQTRLSAELRLKELDSADQREEIDRQLAARKHQSGRCPFSLEEVIPALSGPGPGRTVEFQVNEQGRLVDPSGAPYLLDRERCAAILDSSRTKIPKN